MARKPNKTGRNETEHFVRLERRFLELPAWRALSLAGKAIYPFIRLEWHGPQSNNNGRIRLSVRQAAERSGMGMNAAARAFQDLQAKGFLFVTEMGVIGFTGEARGPSFEITELEMPGKDRYGGRRLYAQWQKGHDFPVVKHNANNPKGNNGDKSPTPKRLQSRVQKGDVGEKPVIKTVTPHPQNGDVLTNPPELHVTDLMTSLLTIPDGIKPSDARQATSRTMGPCTAMPGLKQTQRLPPTFQMIS